MPPHDTYIETHLGGGTIMKHKPPARKHPPFDETKRRTRGNEV